MADDSLMEQLKRIKGGVDEPSMTELIQPEQMQANLAREADADDLAKRIQSKMSQKQMAQSAAEGAEDFAARYADKMKAPAGMKLEGIADETARLGMKVPSGLRKSALAKLAGKAAKPAMGAAAGLAGLLMQDELNPEGELIENPDIPADIRGETARAQQEIMQGKMAEQEDFERRKQAREERIEALKAKLRGEAGLE